MTPEERAAALVGLARKGFFFHSPWMVVEQLFAILAACEADRAKQEARWISS